MLKFVKEEKVIYEIDEQEKEPLTYQTYIDLIKSEAKLCLTFSNKKYHAYSAESINTLRYGEFVRNKQFERYEMDDPMSNKPIEDIFYFEINKNEKGNENEDNIIANFICNEVDFIGVEKNRKKIIGDIEEEKVESAHLFLGVVFLFLFAFLVMIFYTVFEFYFSKTRVGKFIRDCL